MAPLFMLVLVILLACAANRLLGNFAVWLLQDDLEAAVQSGGLPSRWNTGRR